jgi:anaerobic ribonucleoside-triphosphate reductase activating protein
LEKDYIAGITFSGGDPLHPANCQAITDLAKEIKETFPTKTLWLYTGFEWEEVSTLEIMNYLDIVVDGRYIDEQRDTTLFWRGSANQRVINVPETLSKGSIVLHCD